MADPADLRSEMQALLNSVFDKGAEMTAFKATLSAIRQSLADIVVLMQGETNYTSFVVTAYKTGCIPVSQTIVTSASATAGYAGVDWGKVTNPTSTVGLSGTTIGTLTTYTGNTPQTGDAYARIGAAGAGLTAIGDTRMANLDAAVTSRLAPTVAGRTLDVSAGGEAGLDWANIGSPTTTVGLSGTTVGTLTTYTGNTPQTGDAFARIGATGSGLTSLAPAATALSSAAIPAGWIAASGIAAGALNGKGDWSTYAGGDTSGVTTLLSRLSATRAGYLDNLGAALAEAYRADGATGTLAELLYEIIAHLGESSIAGTTKTIHKVDGTTAAATFTLDSATTPTAITRAT